MQSLSKNRKVNLMKKLVLALIGALALSSWAASAATNVVSLGQVVYPSVSIASSGTTSAAISTNGLSLVGCQLPATFTGTAITFTVATTVGGTYQALTNASGTLSYTVAQGKYIAINPADFYGVQFFKIVSNATEGATRTLVCSLKGI